MAETVDKVIYRGSPRGTEVKEFLGLLSQAQVKRVAVGRDVMATIDTDLLWSTLRANEFTSEWWVLPVDMLQASIDPRTSVSWLSVHCFEEEVSITPNIAEDRLLFEEKTYRQNWNAVAELYVWNDGEILVIAPTSLELPNVVGSMRMTKRITMYLP